MATIPLRCPDCGEWLRVAAQPSEISKATKNALRVRFDSQTVAHTCKEKE